MSLREFTSSEFANRIRAAYPTTRYARLEDEDLLNQWFLKHPEHIAHIKDRDKFATFNPESNTIQFKNIGQERQIKNWSDPNRASTGKMIYHNLKSMIKQIPAGAVGTAAALLDYITLEEDDPRRRVNQYFNENEAVWYGLALDSINNYNVKIPEGKTKDQYARELAQREVSKRPDYKFSAVERDTARRAGADNLERTRDLRDIATSLANFSYDLKKWADESINETIKNDPAIQAYMLDVDSDPMNWKNFYTPKMIARGFADLAPSIIAMGAWGTVGTVAKGVGAFTKLKALKSAGTGLVKGSQALGLGTMAALEGGDIYSTGLDILVDEYGFEPKDAAPIAGLGTIGYVPVSLLLEKFQFNKLTKALGVNKQADRIFMSTLMNRLAGKVSLEELGAQAKRGVGWELLWGGIDWTAGALEQGGVEGYQQTWNYIISEAMRQGYGPTKETALTNLLKEVGATIGEERFSLLNPFASDIKEINQSAFSGMSGSIIPGVPAIGRRPARAWKQYKAAFHAEKRKDGTRAGFSIDQDGSVITLIKDDLPYYVYNAGTEAEAVKMAEQFRSDLSNREVYDYEDINDEGDSNANIAINREFNTIEDYANLLAGQLELSEIKANTEYEKAFGKNPNNVQKLIIKGAKYDSDIGRKAYDIVSQSGNANIFKQLGLEDNTVKALEREVANYLTKSKSIEAHEKVKGTKNAKKLEDIKRTIGEFSTDDVLDAVAENRYEEMLSEKLDIQLEKKLDDKFQSKIDSKVDEDNGLGQLQTLAKGVDLGNINKKNLQPAQLQAALMLGYLKNGEQWLYDRLRSGKGKANNTTLNKLSKTLGLEFKPDEIRSKREAVIEHVSGTLMLFADQFSQEFKGQTISTLKKEQSKKDKPKREVKEAPPVVEEKKPEYKEVAPGVFEEVGPKKFRIPKTIEAIDKAIARSEKYLESDEITKDEIPDVKARIAALKLGRKEKETAKPTKAPTKKETAAEGVLTVDQNRQLNKDIKKAKKEASAARKIYLDALDGLEDGTATQDYVDITKIANEEADLKVLKLQKKKYGKREAKTLDGNIIIKEAITKGKEIEAIDAQIKSTEEWLSKQKDPVQKTRLEIMQDKLDKNPKYKKVIAKEKKAKEKVAKAKKELATQTSTEGFMPEPFQKETIKKVELAERELSAAKVERQKLEEQVQLDTPVSKDNPSQAKYDAVDKLGKTFQWIDFPGDNLKLAKWKNTYNSLAGEYSLGGIGSVLQKINTETIKGLPGLKPLLASQARFEELMKVVSNFWDNNTDKWKANLSKKDQKLLDEYIELLTQGVNALKETFNPKLKKAGFDLIFDKQEDLKGEAYLDIPNRVQFPPAKSRKEAHAIVDGEKVLLTEEQKDRLLAINEKKNSPVLALQGQAEAELYQLGGELIEQRKAPTISTDAIVQAIKEVNEETQEISGIVSKIIKSEETQAQDIKNEADNINKEIDEDFCL